MVTGEGVLVDVPPTSVASLVVAGLIDYVIAFALMFAGLALLGVSSAGLSDAQIAIAGLLLTATVFLFLPLAIETSTRGRSLGKLAMKLRVVRDDGGPITFRHSMVRRLVAIVEIWMLSGIPAVISAMISTRAKRIGDLAAGTYVVREETAMRLAPGPTMPPALIPWASGADMTALPDGLAIQIRQYLVRLHTLSPSVREQVGHGLLARVLPLVSPPPPTSAPIDAILAAVLAERRRRDRERLRREADLRHRLLR